MSHRFRARGSVRGGGAQGGSKREVVDVGEAGDPIFVIITVYGSMNRQCRQCGFLSALPPDVRRNDM